MLSFTAVLILELYKIHLDYIEMTISFIHFKIIDIIFNYNEYITLL